MECNCWPAPDVDRSPDERETTVSGVIARNRSRSRPRRLVFRPRRPAFFLQSTAFRSVRSRIGRCRISDFFYSGVRRVLPDFPPAHRPVLVFFSLDCVFFSGWGIAWRRTAWRVLVRLAVGGGRRRRRRRRRRKSLRLWWTLNDRIRLRHFSATSPDTKRSKKKTRSQAGRSARKLVRDLGGRVNRVNDEAITATSSVPSRATARPFGSVRLRFFSQPLHSSVPFNQASTARRLFSVRQRPFDKVRLISEDFLRGIIPFPVVCVFSFV